MQLKGAAALVLRACCASGTQRDSNAEVRSSEDQPIRIHIAPRQLPRCRINKIALSVLADRWRGSIHESKPAGLGQTRFVLDKNDLQSDGSPSHWPQLLM